MKKKTTKLFSAALVLAMSASVLTGCGKGASGSGAASVSADDISFPLENKVTITGTISYPSGTESEPNNRTIFKRLEEETNVHVDWTAISNDQWGDKIKLNMANKNTLTDFVFNAGFSNSDLIRYADQGVILPVEEYIDNNMPNLKAVFDKYPEYRTMCEDSEGHIWALPWIEQLGSNKTAIQTVGNNFTYINKKWLDFLGLQTPTTVDEFEEVLKAFKEHASELQAEFGIEGDIIPMSCIMNDQDPSLLINGFGEGYGDNDIGQHIAVTDDKKVICTATQEGFKSGMQWLHQLYEEGLIDPECFTQKNVTPMNSSFTSGFDRGRCVVTSKCENPAFVCAWLDKMYDPFQSPQNNWGTYGEDDEFDIFELSTNANGDKMLKHAPLGDASPVEVREAECVGGPLAILDEYYGVYVTCPDDAQYRLDWIKEYYTNDMNCKYVYPNVFMTADDTEALTTIQTDLISYINSSRSNFVMNGLTDAEWDKYLKQVDAYGLDEYLSIYQKYLDEFYN